MTWIDVSEADGPSITRDDYEQLEALLNSPNAEADEERGFVMTRPALERLLKSIAVALLH
jgi:hypothetical protein